MTSGWRRSRRSGDDAVVKRTPISSLLLAAAIGAGCGDNDAQFDAQALTGTWRGRWTDDAGRRGGVDLAVTSSDDSLHLACDILGVHLPGLRLDTERVDAVIRGSKAVIADHGSDAFGQVNGSIEADGRVAIDCDEVIGPVQSLRALGTWETGTLTLEVDVTYDSSLRTSRAYVEMQRRGRD